MLKMKKFFRHEFYVGDVTTGLVSHGQLYQAGWEITREGSNELLLVDQSKYLCTTRTNCLQSEHVSDKLKNKNMMVLAFILFMLVLLPRCFDRVKLCDFKV